MGSRGPCCLFGLPVKDTAMLLLPPPMPVLHLLLLWFRLLLLTQPLLWRERPSATHPHPMGPVDPVPEPRPGNPLPPEPLGPHPTPAPA